MRTIMMSGFLMLMGCATTSGGVNNTITLAPVRYAVDPLENKPRSKRGQRGRRWQ